MMIAPHKRVKDTRIIKGSDIHIETANYNHFGVFMNSFDKFMSRNLFLYLNLGK